MKENIHNKQKRSGRTTRIIDAAVQELFTKGEVTLHDHYWGDGLGPCIVAHRNATQHAFHVFLERIRTEHGLRVGYEIEVDGYRFAARLIK